MLAKWPHWHPYELIFLIVTIMNSFIIIIYWWPCGLTWTDLANRNRIQHMNWTGHEYQTVGGIPIDYLQMQLRSWTSVITWNKFSWWTEWDLNLGLPGFKSSILTTQPCCLLEFLISPEKGAEVHLPRHSNMRYSTDDTAFSLCSSKASVVW